MSFKDDVGEGSHEESNVELDETLREFRLSIHAWSDERMSRPRSAVASAPRRQHWQLAAAWALCCVLLAGGLSGGVYERHHRQELQNQARIAAARAVEQLRVADEQRDKQLRAEEEDLLAKVDNDVAREVPRAMEPLALLMDGDESR